MTNPYLTKIDRALGALESAINQSAELPCEDAVQLVKDAARAAERVLSVVRDEMEEEALDD